MPSTYDIGDLIRASASYTDTGGNPVDPGTVYFFLDTPTSTAPTTASRSSTSTGSVNGIFRSTIGAYWYNFSATGQGLYEWRYTSTGTATVSEESWCSIRPQRVTS